MTKSKLNSLSFLEKTLISLIVVILGGGATVGYMFSQKLDELSQKTENLQKKVPTISRGLELQSKEKIEELTKKNQNDVQAIKEKFGSAEDSLLQQYEEKRIAAKANYEAKLQTLKKEQTAALEAIKQQRATEIADVNAPYQDEVQQLTDDIAEIQRYAAENKRLILKDNSIKEQEQIETAEAELE